MNQLSPEAEIKAITVNSVDEAQELRFLGSPSIHINGEDIEPDADKRGEYGLGWRFYIDEAGGFVKKVPEEMFIQALKRKVQNKGD